MSQKIDLKEFLSAYLAEVDEQLQASNAKLLEIEASARRGEANPRAVRDLFRAIHTVKGLSAMVGVDAVVAIAHRMEAVLRTVDQGGGHLAPGSVDTFLRGVAAIEQCVRQVADRKTPTPAAAALFEAIDRLEPGHAPAGGASHTFDLDPTIQAKLAPFELDLLRRGGETGRRAVRIDFSPSPTKAERGLSINTVRERVGSLGEIIKVVPVSVAASSDAPGGLSFVLLVLTSASDEELAVAAGVPVESLKQVTSVARPESSRETALPPTTDEPLHPVHDEASAPQHRSIVRVDASRLDDAMQHLSTLIVTRSRLARAVAKLAEAGVNTSDLNEIMRDNARQLRDLRASILRIRMIPMTEVLERIPLILRGLRRESGKYVQLAIDARDAELDKGVAERLFPAMVHIVRNAVDHAIESPEERRAAGKPEEGMLRIACIARSNTRLEVTVTDDGRGVDRAAVERRVGFAIPDSPGALLEALCQSGLTTKTEATTTSGRGMGMDIVKRIVVEQLGGELMMTTEKGVGTTFTLRVPLTVSIVDAFAMDCHRQRFVVPVSMVEEILEIEPAAVRYGPARAGGEKRTGGRTGLLERRGEAVPLLELASVLRIRVDDTPARQAVVVRRNGQPIAFGLDRVIGQQEAVVRPLIDPLVTVLGVSGATDLGDGKPTLVLDLVALAAHRSTHEGGRAA